MVILLDISLLWQNCTLEKPKLLVSIPKAGGIYKWFLLSTRYFPTRGKSHPSHKAGSVQGEFVCPFTLQASLRYADPP